MLQAVFRHNQHVMAIVQHHIALRDIALMILGQYLPQGIPAPTSDQPAESGMTAPIGNELPRSNTLHNRIVDRIARTLHKRFSAHT